jgi:hypothetical protein
MFQLKSYCRTMALHKIKERYLYQNAVNCQRPARENEEKNCLQCVCCAISRKLKLEFEFLNQQLFAMSSHHVGELS